MTYQQHTILKKVTLKGTGLHSGEEVTVTIHPAPDDHGIVFRRVDLPEQSRIRAQVENVVDTSRNTLLEEDGVRIGMVEHSLSALVGLEVDNVLIDVDGPELPILDGSARKIADALITAGITEQNSERRFFEIKDPIVFKDEDNEIEIMGLPSDEFSLSVMIDYNSVVLGNQYASLQKMEDYQREIAPAKTFVFFRELEMLWRSDLIKGGSLDNAMVILEREVSQAELDRVADLLSKPRVHGQAHGILSTTKLEFSNEPARHKLLDLLGDLALIGMPLKGKIIATRPGHRVNVEFAKIIKKAIRQEQERNTVPRYDPTNKPVYDIHDIMDLLPQRPPFLLIDRIMELTDKMVIGVKNVTMNEPFFVGHFPAEPIMPGVLVVETMAQCGGVLVLSTVENPKEYSTYFLKIDSVRFKRKVVPGDTLVIKCELIDPIRRGIARMRSQVFVGGQVVTEGEMLAQIVKHT